jgi:hypothetical protein
MTGDNVPLGPLVTDPNPGWAWQFAIKIGEAHSGTIGQRCQPDFGKPAAWCSGAPNARASWICGEPILEQRRDEGSP